ncbi:uncharacterized protein LOC125658835 [Ostrea edulis]|uniref:uncharacterized protein LOC125658835 n=1 Tax=Ostrea edulis TaxID=37623 RepID=UPI0024AF2D95|nr:uncharacterized protein LOC125658835 [Ostrea edulis]
MDLGFRGWMYDFGEYTPPDSVSADGSSGLEVHNRYPLLYQKACFDHLVKTKDNPNSPYAPDYLFYVRSGYLGTQAVTWAHWTGDPSSDWSETSGLPAQLTAMLNVGISGIPFSGSDIGGFEWYTSPPPDEELWVRWTQLGAFSGYMHEQGGGKGFGRKPHIFDSINGTRLWRKFAKLRTQLFPYIYTQAHTANQVGLPIMRHHILDFDDDNQAISKQYQYMFGDKLLVAPVYKSGVSEREVYLPNNSSWIDISSHLLYDEEDGRFRIGHSDIQLGGKSLIVAASLETCPFFVRAGSIIPLLDPSVLVLREASHPNVTSLYNKTTLHLWVFPDVFKNADGSDWQNNSFAFRNSSVQSNLFTYGMNLRSTQYTWIVSQILLSERPHDLLIEGGVVKSVLSWTQVIPSGADPIGVWSYDQQQRVLWIGSANTVSNITIAVPYISL